MEKEIKKLLDELKKQNKALSKRIEDVEFCKKYSSRGALTT